MFTKKKKQIDDSSDEDDMSMKQGAIGPSMKKMMGMVDKSGGMKKKSMFKKKMK